MSRWRRSRGGMYWLAVGGRRWYCRWVEGPRLRTGGTLPGHWEYGYRGTDGRLVAQGNRSLLLEARQAAEGLA